jgi:hypothetical protein
MMFQPSTQCVIKVSQKTYVLNNLVSSTGFLVTLTTICAPFLVSMLGLAAFTNWMTALVFAAGIGVISWLAVRFHTKHDRPYEWDDHLSENRVDTARESLVATWKEKNVED